MKLKIHKKNKKVWIFIFTLLLILFGLQLFFLVAVPKTISRENVLYEAACIPNVTYKAVINPNEVFPDPTQNEGAIYSKKILNYIQADFEVIYTGSKPVPLDIEYQLVATAEGSAGDEPNKTIYWSKSFPLSDIKKIKANDTSSWSKKERVNFQLSDYDAFAVRAKEITGMSVSNNIRVAMLGKVIAHDGKENLEIPFEVMLQMPLMEEVFQIKKIGTDQIKEEISVTEEAPKPLDFISAISYGGGVVLCLIGLIVMIFYSREPSGEEILQKKVNYILKNYGSRVAAMHSIPKINYRQCYTVHSMKDMIKIADELQKPIFYEVDKDTIVKDNKFHVIEADTLYSLFLESQDA